MSWILVFLLVCVLAAERTLLHTFALAVDDALADVGANRVGCLTLSSYAGRWARHGREWPALVIGFVFLSWPPFGKWTSGVWKPYLLMHTEEAMTADIGRACDSLNVLLANDTPALALIASIRQRTAQP